MAANAIFSVFAALLAVFARFELHTRAGVDRAGVDRFEQFARRRFAGIKKAPQLRGRCLVACLLIVIVAPYNYLV